MFAELMELKNSGQLSKAQLAEKIAALRLPPFLGFLSRHSANFVVLSIWTLPTLLTLSLYNYASQLNTAPKYLGFSLIPLVFISSFILVAGIFAQIGRKGIIEGKFPRLSEHPIYALRKIYGAAWTQVYYFKPLYAICLAVPFLKKFLFRFFGYKGDLSFIVYPDCWLRDLTLLKISKGVYLANRSTIGTNMCLNDGTILVGPIEFGENCMIGHLAMLALGSVFGKNTELGVNSAIGIRVTIQDDVKIAPRSEINHAAVLMNKCRIGFGCTVGMRSKIGPNITIPDGACVPPGTYVLTQEDCNDLFKKERVSLEEHKNSVISILEGYFKGGTSARTN
jgi:carbonic anhydrase/acetyltransferase-like protein (isoleucine patch superfamily)